MRIYTECLLCRRRVHRDEAVIYDRNSRYLRRVCLYCIEKLTALKRDKEATLARTAA